jgi:putative transcriptional regulator
MPNGNVNIFVNREIYHYVLYMHAFSILAHHILEMNRIKEVLEEKGIKQTWLAEKLGKSYPIVNSYVQNRRQPSIVSLFEIGQILNVEPSDLIKKVSYKENVL